MRNCERWSSSVEIFPYHGVKKNYSFGLSLVLTMQDREIWPKLFYICMILELFQIFKKKLPQSNVCQFDLFSCWLKCKMGSFLHFLNHTPKIICSNFRPTVFMANLRYRIFDNISFNNPHNNPHFKF